MRFIYTRAFGVFFAILTISAVFVFLQTKGFVDPIKRIMLEAPKPVTYVLRGIVGPIRDFFSTVSALKEIANENVRLSERIKELEQQVVSVDQLRSENQLLLSELGFAKASKYELIRCTVLSYDPQGITNTFVINCGKNKGLSQGMAVLSNSHVAGRLIYVGNQTSTAEFVTNPNSTIDGKISRSGSLGLVRGSFASGLVFESLSQTSDFNKGDLVVTAGVNSLIPAGLVIGEVDKVITQDNELFKKTTVISPLVFRTLNYVFIVK